MVLMFNTLDLGLVVTANFGVPHGGPPTLNAVAPVAVLWHEPDLKSSGRVGPSSFEAPACG